MATLLDSAADHNADEHVCLLVTPRTTRTQIQAEIGYHRRRQLLAVIPSTAREQAAVADRYLDALLAAEPEPV